MKINARSLAVQILLRIEEEGAYANFLLQNQLSLLPDVRDRQLTTLLVNGVIKHRLTLDYILRKHLRKPMSALPREVRAILRVGVFQLFYLDKIPPSAAIYEAVEMTKKKHANFTPLVNGVLRQILRQNKEITWPDPNIEPVRYLSVRYSHPEWMVKDWIKRLGFAEAERLCQTNNEPAPTWIRVNTLKTSRDELIKSLQEERVVVEKGKRVPESLLIKDFGAVERLESFRKGLFTVQDESSQLVAHVLDPRPGEKVLDVCSAPGGKTSHLAQLMENKGEIFAFDIHPHKIDLINELALRLGIDIIKTQLGDARELRGIADYSMDKVLADVPCSGLGVLRRKADLRWHKKEEDIRQLPELQLKILECAAQKVKYGGTLVYSTCTIAPEENFEVVKAFRQVHPEFAPADLTETLMPFLLNDNDKKQAQKGMLQLFPHRHGTDGFFLAKFYRNEV